MSREIEWLEYDSRKVRPHSIFFAVEGERADGHDYVDSALQRGAAAVVSERTAPGSFPAPWIRVSDVRAYMAIMADEFYGSPSREIPLIGVTGTNGKTTTAFVIHSILACSKPALLMGTVKTLLGDLEAEAVRTTPEAIDLQRTLREAVERGCRHGVVEVSSHALFLKRVYRCRFPVAVFTNLSQDHLDFHGDMEAYFQAKRLLFQRRCNPGLRHAVVNGDDPYSARIGLPPEVEATRFGFSTECDVYPIEHGTSVDGSRLRLRFFDRELELTTALAGDHNCLNVMAAAAACRRLGLSDRRIAEGVASLAAVPGRFERVPLNAPFAVFVDYAHTPDALSNALRLARSLCRGRLICVFGCGGDRDRAKRPLMGRTAVLLSDYAVVTSDNPRSEPPLRIIEEIQAGIPKQASNWETEADRRAALARALRMARNGDLVLVAGKGHETYQEIAGEKIHFDDREVVREVF